MTTDAGAVAAMGRRSAPLFAAVLAARGCWAGQARAEPLVAQGSGQSPRTASPLGPASASANNVFSVPCCRYAGPLFPRRTSSHVHCCVSCTKQPIYPRNLDPDADGTTPVPRNHGCCLCKARNSNSSWRQRQMGCRELEGPEVVLQL